MATAFIDIDIDIDEPQEHFEDMQDKAKDLRPVWKYAKQKLEKSFSQNFLNGGTLVPGGWAPLDRGYAAWKSSNYPGAKKLVIDGKLFRSIATLEESAVNKIDKTHATFGTDVEYAKFHQYGTTKMPARKIVFEPKGFSRDISKKISEFVVNRQVYG